jgi:hypothetical protein
MRKTKVEIVQAVKAAANADGSDTIGKARFYMVTGIPEAAWTYYWPRWNELLEEAGLAPGAMQGRLSDDDVVVALIPLIRQRGRWPTHREVSIYARAHPGFPADTTVRSRGDRATLAHKLLEHCRDRAELSDVAEICEKIAAARPANDLFESKDAIQGYVYLMKSGRDYKIGKTKSPHRRKGEIAPLLPNETEIIHKIPTDDPDGIERYWHTRFEAKRQRGEWFRLDRSDIRAFKRRNYM